MYDKFTEMLDQAISGRNRAVRRRDLRVLASDCSEVLELRSMLSASMSGAMEVSVEESVAPNHEKFARYSKRTAKAELPDLSGTWDCTTVFGPSDQVEGVLNLTQNGRKITGTITNDGQPPQPFKGKFTPGQDRADGSLGTVKGKMKNLSIESKKYLKFLLDVVGEAGILQMGGGIKSDVDVQFNATQTL